MESLDQLHAQFRHAAREIFARTNDSPALLQDLLNVLAEGRAARDGGGQGIHWSPDGHWGWAPVQALSTSNTAGASSSLPPPPAPPVRPSIKRPQRGERAHEVSAPQQGPAEVQTLTQGLGGQSGAAASGSPPIQPESAAPPPPVQGQSGQQSSTPTRFSQTTPVGVRHPHHTPTPRVSSIRQQIQLDMSPDVKGKRSHDEPDLGGSPAKKSKGGSNSGGAMSTGTRKRKPLIVGEKGEDLSSEGTGTKSTRTKSTNPKGKSAKTGR